MIFRLVLACLFLCETDGCANRASAPQRSDLLIIASTIEPESLNPLYLQGRVYQDIDALGSRLALINIALVPVLISVFALMLAGLRRRKRAQAAGA